MKKGSGLAVLVVAVLVAAVAAGCGSTKAPDANRWAADYYGQLTNTPYEVIHLEGANTITLAGSNMVFIVKTAQQPLSILPRDPSLWSTLFTETGRTILGAFGIYWAGQTMQTLAQRPQVERVETQVPMPTQVITAPAP